MVWERYRAPHTPPPLEERVTLSDEQRQRAAALIAGLSQSLEALPVVLSQEGEVICSAGLADERHAERLTRVAGRIWREGADQTAREVIRFEEEVLGSNDERTSFMIYTAHVAGALTLTIGWQLSPSLTQLRAEVGDVIAELQRLLEST